MRESERERERDWERKRERYRERDRERGSYVTYSLLSVLIPQSICLTRNKVASCRLEYKGHHQTCSNFLASRTQMQSRKESFSVISQKKQNKWFNVWWSSEGISVFVSSWLSFSLFSLSLRDRLHSPGFQVGLLRWLMNVNFRWMCPRRKISTCLIDIINPLFTILSSADNKSQQHHKRNSWECREPNPGLPGERQECYLCAIQSPINSRYFIATLKTGKLQLVYDAASSASFKTFLMTSLASNKW